MAKIVGIIKTSFIPKDSKVPVEGLSVYVTEPINPKRGEGVSTDHFFLDKDKVSALNFTVSLNQEVEILYTKWGKVGSLRLIDEELDFN